MGGPLKAIPLIRRLINDLEALVVHFADETEAVVETVS